MRWTLAVRPATRAIASSAGGAPHGRAEKHANGFTKCEGQVPVATMALHGTHDFGVGLESGVFSAQYWAYVNGCDTSAMETTGGSCARLRWIASMQACAYWRSLSRFPSRISSAK